MVKLVIWDLDDTLWQGTLADGEAVTPIAHRFALVRRLNAHGVVSSICSKNDPAVAEAELRRFGLWDAFVFPSIAFAPKGPAVAGIIADMQLRAVDVLFVDDNRANLQEVGHALPGIQLLDSTAPDADERLEAILTDQKASRDRVAEYRILEAKKRDRQAANLSNEAFLHSCGIQACAPFLMDNLAFLDRIVELINRSNQLNYTQSRVTPAALEAAIIDVVRHDSWSIFAWDRYGAYGLVGFVMVDRASQRFVHFAFSCRVMHMGLESFALRKVREKWPLIDAAHWADRFATADPAWIADRPFHDPEIRAQILAALPGEAAAGTPRVRIMFDCQSGGIAHYSRHRAAIAFDNNPRLFGMRQLLDGTHREQLYAPAIVFGPGIDYSDPRWPGWALAELETVYRACVERFCAFFAAKGVQALILLCPETMPDAKYRPHMGHSRARTIALNAEWRRAAGKHGWITLVELDALAEPDMLSDVSHYHPTLLQRMAGAVDAWLDALPAAEALFDSLDDAAFVTAGQAALDANRLGVLPDLLCALAKREVLAGSEAGQVLLIRVLGALIAICAGGEVALAAQAIRAAGVDLAALGAALLEQAVAPPGEEDIADLADGTLFAWALLLARGGNPERALALLHVAEPVRDRSDFSVGARAVRNEIAVRAGS